MRNRYRWERTRFEILKELSADCAYILGGTAVAVTSASIFLAMGIATFWGVRETAKIILQLLGGI